MIKVNFCKLMIIALRCSIHHSSFIIVIHHHHSLFIIILHCSSLSSSLIITVLHPSSLIAAVVAIDINFGQIFAFSFHNCQDRCWQTSSMKPLRAVVAAIHLFIIGVKRFIALETFVYVDLLITIGITIINDA